MPSMLGFRRRFLTSASVLLNFSTKPRESVNLRFFFLEEGGSNFMYFSLMDWMVRVLISLLLKVTLIGFFYRF